MSAITSDSAWSRVALLVIDAQSHKLDNVQREKEACELQLANLEKILKKETILRFTEAEKSASLQEKVDRLTKDLLAMGDEKARLSTAHFEQMTLANRFEADLKIARENIARAETRAEVQGRELSEVTSEKDKLLSMVKALRETATRQADKCPSQCSSRAELTRIQKSSSAIKEQISHLKRQNESLTAQLATHEGSLERMRAEIKALNKKLREEKAKHEECEEGLRSSETDKSALTTKVVQLAKDYDRQEKILKEQSSRIVDMSAHFSDSLRQKDNMIGQYLEIIAKLQTEIGAETRRSSEWERRDRDKEKMLERQRGDIAALSAELFGEKNLRSKTMAAISSWEQRDKEREEILAKQSTEIAELRAQLLVEKSLGSRFTTAASTASSGTSSFYTLF